MTILRNIFKNMGVDKGIEIRHTEMMQKGTYVRFDLYIKGDAMDGTYDQLLGENATLLKDKMRAEGDKVQKSKLMRSVISKGLKK